MIDFEAKRGRGQFKFWNTSEDITDLLTTSYDEPTGAMRQLTQHLLPAISAPKADQVTAEDEAKPIEPPVKTEALFADETTPAPVAAPAPAVTETAIYDWSNVTFDIAEEASKSPLDGAIAAAIAMAGTENKVKNASMSILLIGGTSALKGIGAFVSERYVPSASKVSGDRADM
jgi:actin-related protein 8